MRKDAYKYLDEHILKEYFQISEQIVENVSSETVSHHLQVDDKKVIVYRNKDGAVSSVVVDNDEGGLLTRELEELDNHIAKKTNTLFIVYGHGDDNKERNALQEILQSWNFNPIYLDQKVNHGQTIIEKLETFMEEAKMGIILATPDDIGYVDNEFGRLNPRYRVRQNVVLEMGMLMGLKARDKLVVLKKDDKQRPMELPGDIDGMVRIEFKGDVSEAKSGLMGELFHLYDIRRSDVRENVAKKES